MIGSLIRNENVLKTCTEFTLQQFMSELIATKPVAERFNAFRARLLTENSITETGLTELKAYLIEHELPPATIVPALLYIFPTITASLFMPLFTDAYKTHNRLLACMDFGYILLVTAFALGYALYEVRLICLRKERVKFIEWILIDLANEKLGQSSPVMKE